MGGNGKEHTSAEVIARAAPRAHIQVVHIPTCRFPGLKEDRNEK